MWEDEVNLGNGYTFVGNDPVNERDPFGLCIDEHYCPDGGGSGGGGGGSGGTCKPRRTSGEPDFSRSSRASGDYATASFHWLGYTIDSKMNLKGRALCFNGFPLPEEGRARVEVNISFRCDSSCTMKTPNAPGVFQQDTGIASVIVSYPWTISGKEITIIATGAGACGASGSAQVGVPGSSITYPGTSQQASAGLGTFEWTCVKQQ